MTNAINVCVSIPDRHDNRPPAERDATLAKFKALDSRLQFHFVEYVENTELRTLRALPDLERVKALAPPLSAELLAAFAEADIILAIDLPSDMHLLAPRLRWVQSVGGGVAQLQTCGLDKLGAKLTSGAGLTADPIAEFALARILSHWKLFSFYDQMQQQGLWKPAFGRNLAGSTIGIVGYGAIGKAIAWRARAWGMEVLATRRKLPAADSDPAVDTFYGVDELDALLAHSDAVVLAASETPQTYRMFDSRAFAAMKPGSYFCNVSRGSLVDEDALRHALDSGHLAGASIDVAVEEPLPPHSPLWTTRNLAISPHSSPSLERFSHATWELFYDNMSRYLGQRPLRNLRSNALETGAP